MMPKWAFIMLFAISFIAWMLIDIANKRRK